MTETPEWFELTKNDERPSSNEPKKSRTRLSRVLAFTIPLVIVGGTMVLAESGGEAEDLPPTAVAQTTSDATNQNSDSNSDIKVTNNSSGNSTTKSSTTATVAVVANSAAPSNQGVGVPKPLGGDREGHVDGEPEEREHDDHHEHKDRDDD